VGRLVLRDVEVFAVGRAAHRLHEKLHEHEAEDYAQPAEDDERPAPAVVLADQPTEEPACDGADVDGSLMRPHGARARSSAVIVADQ
jgi:hypothetical protein